MYSIYLITNTINGKRYVGQTSVGVQERWWQHCGKKTNCSYLNNAIQKYGKENFEIETIFEVPTQELANEFEKEWIANLCSLSPNGYNLTTGGAAPKASAATRAKISASNTGKPCHYRRVYTEAEKQEISLISRGSGNGSAKLSDVEVFEIRGLYATGNYTQLELAKKFNVSTTAILRIIRHKGWKHLGEPLENLDHLQTKANQIKIQAALDSNERRRVLTEAQVQEIIKLRYVDKISSAELAERFSVNVHAIRKAMDKRDKTLFPLRTRGKYGKQKNPNPYVRTPEHRQAIGKLMRGNKNTTGFSHSEETKKKISETKKRKQREKRET